MSAQNMSYTSRIAHDNYPTPAWVTHRLLDEVSLPRGVWYEPCAGDGALVRAVQSWESDRGRVPCAWVTGDVRACRVPHDGRHFQRSFLDAPREACDVIISNPPFSLADAIARKAAAEAPIVALLLSLSWPKAGKRAAWLREHPPSCFPIPQPVAFVTCYKCSEPACAWEGSELPEAPTLPCCPQCAGRLRRSAGDMVGYGWYVWGLPGAPTYRVLRHTSLEERRLTP